MSYPNIYYKSGIALTLSAVACVLTACQSSATSGMNHYQQPVQPQLLNLSHNPSSSATAKSNLVSAIQKNFAHEHMSASNATYAIRPFTNADSVDADSESLFITLMSAALKHNDKKELKEKEAEEYKESLIEEYIEEIEAEEQEALAMAKERGEEIETLDEYDIQEEAEERAEEFIELEEDDSKATLSEILKSSSNPKRKTKKLLQEYANIKSEEVKSDEADSSEAESKFSLNDILRSKNSSEFMLEALRSTPEQIETMQAHHLQHLQVNQLGHYQPETKVYQSVVSYEYTSSTQQLSLQLPYGVDFERGSVTVDPSAGLPFIALLKPEMLPDLEKNKTHTVNFSLPKAFREKIPTDIIFNAFIKGNNQAFSELDSEYYTPLDITNDEFAKQVHAKKAVKIHWGMKQTGEYIGKVVKSMSQDLHAYIGDHPEKYSPKDTDRLNKTLKIWSSIEQDFQSKDVGSLLQLIEAVAPISVNQTMYYYLSSDNDLQAFQTKMSMGSELYGWTMDTVVQTKYDMASVKKSPLYALYDDDFGKNSAKPFDVNAWMSDSGKYSNENSEKVLIKQARYARYDYPDWDEEPESDSEEPLESDVLLDDINNATDSDTSEDDELEQIKQAYRDFEK